MVTLSQDRATVGSNTVLQTVQNPFNTFLFTGRIDYYTLNLFISTVTDVAVLDTDHNGGCTANVTSSIAFAILVLTFFCYFSSAPITTFVMIFADTKVGNRVLELCL